jgi:uncharacterized SAM-binding protein YcdF (DUF218 family)
MATAPMSYRRRVRRFYTHLGLLVVVLIVSWGVGLLRFDEYIPPLPVVVTDQTDAIVVLTGGSGRLEAGLDLLTVGAADRLFISGVYQSVDVATLLKMFRENPAELEARVEIGNATNTRENATETAQWIETQWAPPADVVSIRLVTAAYHMPRSMLEFGYAMPNVKLYPYPVFPEHVKSDWWLWPGTAGLVIKEYNKFLFSWVRISMATLLSKPIQ